MNRDYIQIHTFELFEGMQVVLDVPALTLNLGKLLYSLTLTTTPVVFSRRFGGYRRKRLQQPSRNHYHNDQFVPFVLAYAKRALIEAKDGQDKPDRKHKS
jgi:hypothetical protein